MRTETSVARLTIDLPVHMHRLVKTHATLSDLSIKDFIIETIAMRFTQEKSSAKNSVKKDKISPNKMNDKTIAVIEDSIRNHDKLRSFDDADEAMKWLLSDGKSKKTKKNTPQKSAKKNEKN